MNSNKYNAALFAAGVVAFAIASFNTSSKTHEPETLSEVSSHHAASPAVAVRPARTAHHRVAQASKPRRVAVVTVVDHTAGTWPGLPDVVRAWSRSRYVDAEMFSRCRAHTYCLTVEANHYGATPWFGQTWPTGRTSATTQLNLSIAASPDLQSGAFCHEMGHALGIAHPDPNASRPGVHGCIASTDPNLTVPVPSYYDRQQAATIARGDIAGAQGTPQRWGALWSLALDSDWR